MINLIFYVSKSFKNLSNCLYFKESTRVIDSYGYIYNCYWDITDRKIFTQNFISHDFILNSMFKHMTLVSCCKMESEKSITWKPECLTTFQRTFECDLGYTVPTIDFFFLCKTNEC